LAALAISLLAFSPLASQGGGAAVSEREVAGHQTGPRPYRHLEASRSETCRSARKAVGWYRGRQANWLKLRGVRVERSGRAPRSCPDARYLAGVARARSLAARRATERHFKRRAAERRALYEKWRCIHEHEGAWNDPNPPHWGGLQFDLDFQRTYGPEFYARWGTADKWPVWAQIETAERAYAVRGFGPWPNTRRMCGV